MPRTNAWKVLTRSVSPRLAECELTHLAREPMDVARAAKQHRDYETCLARLGVDVKRLQDLPNHPDGVFVEDAACVVEEVALIGRMGVASRAAEVASVVDALSFHRPLARIERPATLEGGDVLVAGRRVLIGRSTRTDEEGFRQAREILEPLGYDVRAVPVTGCLHLKTGCCALDDRRLLVNPEWVDVSRLDDFELVPVPAGEPWGANLVSLEGAAILPRSHARTAHVLTGFGHRVLTLDLSELQKAEAGVTCLGILFR